MKRIAFVATLALVCWFSAAIPPALAQPAPPGAWVVKEQDGQQTVHWRADWDGQEQVWTPNFAGKAYTDITAIVQDPRDRLFYAAVYLGGNSELYQINLWGDGSAVPLTTVSGTSDSAHIVIDESQPQPVLYYWTSGYPIQKCADSGSGWGCSAATDSGGGPFTLQPGSFLWWTNAYQSPPLLVGPAPPLPTPTSTPSPVPTQPLSGFTYAGGIAANPAPDNAGCELYIAVRPVTTPDPPLPLSIKCFSTNSGSFTDDAVGGIAGTEYSELPNLRLCPEGPHCPRPTFFALRTEGGTRSFVQIDTTYGMRPVVSNVDAAALGFPWTPTPTPPPAPTPSPTPTPVPACPPGSYKTDPGFCGCDTPDEIDPDTGIYTCFLPSFDPTEPVTPDTQLGMPQIGGSGKIRRLYMQQFSGASLEAVDASLLSAAKKGKLTVRYRVRVTRVNSKGQHIRAYITKRNRLTLKKLKSGEYSVTYRVNIMQGNKIAAKTNWSPSNSFSISR